jgi:hypothetical protein
MSMHLIIPFTNKISVFHNSVIIIIIIITTTTTTTRGKAMVNYPQELAQDEVYQSHTSRLTGLWFLPNWPKG